MAAHIETGTMVHPKYSSKLLINEGLVAGMYDELGIGELLDRLIVQDDEKRTVSLGQAVKAMVLNGLGFANRALYLTPLFFQDKPVERLIGEGIEAEHHHCDVLGRASFCDLPLWTQFVIFTNGRAVGQTLGVAVSFWPPRFDRFSHRGQVQ